MNNELPDCTGCAEGRHGMVTHQMGTKQHPTVAPKTTLQQTKKRYGKIKECPTCEAEFKSRRSTHKFCSVTCGVIPRMSDSPSYFAVHMWLRYHYKKTGVCDFCKENKITEFALKRDKKYIRERENFLELCRSCHRKYDVTDEFREKSRQVNIGRTYPQRWKPVIAIKDGKQLYFKSQKYAAKDLGIHRCVIMDVLAGRAKTAGGYSFKRP